MGGTALRSAAVCVIMSTPWVSAALARPIVST